MPKRTLFTNITALPPEITREVAVAMLHDHDEMIELNPLVIEHHPIKTPRDAPADEFLDCVWQEMTDKIHYLPGGIVKGKVSYKACFHDLPRGLQTHIYAPLGLDIREKWSIGGSLPGEPPEPRELGLDVPAQGLYLREDGDMRCSRFLTSFVRKNLDEAHKVLVERILKKAQRIERHRETMSHHSYQTSNSAPTNNAFQAGSHMSHSKIIHSHLLNSYHPPQAPTQPQPPNLMDHPAFRNPHNRSWSSPSANVTLTNGDQSYHNGFTRAPAKQFVAELPGSYTHPQHHSTPQPNRYSVATELSSQEVSRNSLTPQNQSERGGSSVSEGWADGITGVSAYSNANGYVYDPRDFGQHSQQQQQQQQQQQHDETVGGKANRISELPAMEAEHYQRLR